MSNVLNRIKTISPDNILDTIASDPLSIKTFVVNLDDYKENFTNQLPYLENIGLHPERFPAINAIKNEHLDPKYIPYISRYARYFTPKSTIGCSLSHILLAHHINEQYIENKNPIENRDTINDRYFLIMEDDAFPVQSYNTEELFQKTLYSTIDDIEIMDKEWDIIQLHSDALFPTHETYHTHFFCGSTAAYLISVRGIRRMLKECVTNHVDFVTQNFIKYNKYRARSNLFYTDETKSLNRKKANYYLVLIKKVILQRLIPLRGEKDWGHFLNFKFFRLPYIDHDLTGTEFLDYLALFFLLRISLKMSRKYLN